MIRTWKITSNTIEELQFADQSSLDAVTRQLPDGYYSTFRTYDGCTRVLGLKHHLQRLPSVDVSHLRRSLIHLLEPYRANEARVRVMMSFDGQVHLSIEPLKLLPREIYEKGASVETTELNRSSPRIKSTAFIGESDVERKHLAQTGIFEALLVKNGKILEGMTSNFFYAQDGTLYTAQRDILLGVTRRTVIRVARGMGIDVKYIPLKLAQLSTLDEALITSSSRGIVPVVQIDDVTVGEGAVGSITRQLMSAYEEYVLKTAEKI